MTMKTLREIRVSKPARARLLAAVLACACWGSLTGCSLLDMARAREDKEVREMASADGVQGPLERFLQTGSFKNAKQMKFDTPPEASRLFEEGESMYKLGEYAAAEKLFRQVAKGYKDYTIREEALFMLAECQFQQKEYPGADDSYGRVTKEFPSTRYLDTISQRRFEIARTWLGFPDIVTSSDVEPVNFDKPSDTPPPPASPDAPRGLSYSIPIWPNWTDKTRPAFDTKGRALVALKSIWLDDPTGPLADDAIMLTASHHLREGNFVEADHMYATLRKEYPKSRHLENAFVLGSHVKLMSYQGPAYNGTSLDEARQLRESTLRIYPNTPDRERLLAEIQKIEDAAALRDWKVVEYYQKQRKPRAVAVYCKEVIKNYPNSQYAVMARETLAKIDAADKADVVPTPYSQESEEPSGKSKLEDAEPNEFLPEGDPDSISPGGDERRGNGGRVVAGEEEAGRATF